MIEDVDNNVWVGALTTLVTHIAGSSELFRNAMQMQRKWKKGRPRVTSKKCRNKESYERSYVLLCDGVHFGVSDKMRLLHIGL